jgi:multidrug resistance efflux pump
VKLETENTMNTNPLDQIALPRAGWLRASEARIDGQVVEVTANMQGRLNRVLVAEAQLVQKGELLVELDHRELDRKIDAAAAELDPALVASLAAGGCPVPASGQRPGVFSRVELPASPRVIRARARYLHARINRLNAEVRAPVAGRVIARGVQPREYIALSQPLVSILESDDLWVLAHFGPHVFGRLRVGQRATVRAGGRLLAAKVTALVGPRDPALLEFIARPVMALRPGMLAAVAVDAS